MKTFIQKWSNVNFETSCSETEQFRKFRTELKKELKKLLSPEYELHSFYKGHFEVSGFIKNKTGKLVYFSCSDVRFFKNWWADNLLVRTALHDKDWTGGPNDYCDLIDINKKLSQLFKDFIYV